MGERPGRATVRFALVELSRDELLWVNNALNEVLYGPEATEEWEFHARIGGQRHEVRALLQKVSDQLDERPRGDGA
jgi:hypothetical protein